MATLDESRELRIGEALKAARTRQELDISTVEDRTKIRTKYLRALEAEQWGSLPNPAYAKGFLRTYATLLGLDADAIVDEYRRQVETDLPEEHRYPLGEPLLERRRRPGSDGGPGLPRAGLIAAGLAGVVILLLVLAIVGEDDGGSGDRAVKREHQQRQELRRERRQERRQNRQAAQAQAEQVALRLEINSEVSVCLIGGGDQPLIDDQLLGPGAVEGPYQARTFELRFPLGYDREQLDVFVAGRRERLPERTGPAAFRIVPPGRVRVIETPAEACP
jgi:hypothetical protein